MAMAAGLFVACVCSALRRCQRLVRGRAEAGRVEHSQRVLRVGVAVGGRLLEELDRGGLAPFHPLAQQPHVPKLDGSGGGDPARDRASHPAGLCRRARKGGDEAEDHRRLDGPRRAQGAPHLEQLGRQAHAVLLQRLLQQRHRRPLRVLRVHGPQAREQRILLD
eukprot:scaffold60162_cov24-Phaeocystis_antarctica.AAC.1